MGAFGSLLHAIVTMKNHKKLWPKRKSMFAKPTSFKEMREQFRSINRETRFEKAAPKEVLDEIRLRIQARNAKKKKFLIGFLIAFGLLITILGYYFLGQKTIAPNSPFHEHLYR